MLMGLKLKVSVLGDNLDLVILDNKLALAM